MALASASYFKLINATLNKLELRDQFNVIHSAEIEPYGKPHPGIFLTTAKNLGVDPEFCLVFEDSLNGVIAAKAARMKCVCVPDPAFRNDTRFSIADIILNSLEEWNESYM